MNDIDLDKLAEHVRIAELFASQFISGAQGATMDWDDAKALAEAIKTLLDEREAMKADISSQVKALAEFADEIAAKDALLEQCKRALGSCILWGGRRKEGNGDLLPEHNQPAYIASAMAAIDALEAHRRGK